MGVDVCGGMILKNKRKKAYLSRHTQNRHAVQFIYTSLQSPSVSVLLLLSMIWIPSPFAIVEIYKFIIADGGGKVNDMRYMFTKF